MPMSINVEVVKKNSESTTNLIRRFTKKMQGSGVVKRVRSIRYNSRPLSKFTRRKNTLKKLEKTAKVEYMKKMGKM